MKPTDEYIFNQPQLYRAIISHIIAVVEAVSPEMVLEYKYGILYFYLHKKPFCYLAANHKKKFVDVGFAKGFQLKTNLAVLVSQDRNTVKSLRYFSLETINNQVLIEVITEALQLY